MSDEIQELIDSELGDPTNPFGHAFESAEDEKAVLPLPEKGLYRIPKGKYKGLVLPQMIGVKPSMMDRIDAMKADIVNDPEFRQQGSAIAWTYAELRREAQEKAEELSEIKIRLTACMMLMLDQFEVEGTLGASLADGSVIRVDPTPHLIIIDKPTFRQAAIDDGLEALMGLPWPTANKLMKERALEGHDTLAGSQLYMRPKVNFSDPFRKKR
jgi:hypothetical protein